MLGRKKRAASSGTRGRASLLQAPLGEEDARNAKILKCVNKALTSGQPQSFSVGSILIEGSFGGAHVREPSGTYYWVPSLILALRAKHSDCEVRGFALWGDPRVNRFDPQKRRRLYVDHSLGDIFADARKSAGPGANVYACVRVRMRGHTL